ncbi:MAG: hypothetical protein M1820_003459 [Bogoriella megaspora]|nr:MAG: hypothetical protein M1820_003459 [Bogoriella megaspora]
MICARCLLRSARQNSPRQVPRHELSSIKSQLQHRSYKTTASRSAKAISIATATETAPRQGSPDSPHAPPSATSTSAAQPFSTPLTPSPERAGIQSTPTSESVTRLIQSSVPAGTPLRGLNFMKGKNDPLAKEDSEYPDWLWGILDDAEAKAGKGKEGQEGDMFAKSKKQRRLAAKQERKQALLNPESLAPKVPIYEQSIDLPSGDGTIEGALVAGEARGELTRAMRRKRRAAIKEDNFLRTMG